MNKILIEAIKARVKDKKEDKKPESSEPKTPTKADKKEDLAEEKNPIKGDMVSEFEKEYGDKEDAEEKDSELCLMVDGKELTTGKDIVDYVEKNRDKLLGE